MQNNSCRQPVHAWLLQVCLLFVQGCIVRNDQAPTAPEEEAPPVAIVTLAAMMLCQARASRASRRSAERRHEWPAGPVPAHLPDCCSLGRCNQTLAVLILHCRST